MSHITHPFIYPSTDLFLILHNIINVTRNHTMMIVVVYVMNLDYSKISMV